MWITLNEPFCSAILGYYSGVHAPGYTDLGEAFCAVHHLLLAHALALAGYRETGLTAPIGITLNLAPGRAATESEKDREANAIFLALHSEIFTMPLFEGRYPKILEQFGIPFPVEDGDMELISRKMDFIGINFYDQGPIEWSDEDRLHFACAPFWEEKTDMGWPITPYYLLALLRWVNKVSRGLPIYITENGCACRDTVSSDGRVHDRERIDFFKDYLEATEEAIREGIPVKGYYVWSFMDNYEWSFGYSKRFGIVYVDYDTEERIAKDSAYFFRDINAGFRYW